MNSLKAEKCLNNCQFLSHFTKYPVNKFSSQSTQLKLEEQIINLGNLSITNLHKQVIQMTLQKIYLYLICFLNKAELYQSQKTYVTNQGLIFMFFDLSDKYRKRLIKKDTRNFGKNVIEIYQKFAIIMENIGLNQSYRLEELKKFIIRNLQNIQSHWTATNIIQELEKLDIFKENIVLLNYIQNSILKAVKDKNSCLNKYFIPFNILKVQSQQISLKAVYSKASFFNMMTTIKSFLQTASETIKLKLKPTEDQFKLYRIFEQIQTFNSSKKQIFVKHLKQQFLFNYTYQSRQQITKQSIKVLKEFNSSVIQDQVFVRVEFSKQSQQSVIQLNLCLNLDWKIHSIDFPQFQLIFNQIIKSLSEVQILTQTDQLIQKDIKRLKMEHHSSSNSLFIQNSFKLQILNTVFYQFTFALDQMILLAKIMHPICQIYSQKSIKKILDIEPKELGSQQLFILKEQAKRCYTVYNQLFQMFIQSKKN